MRLAVINLSHLSGCEDVPPHQTLSDSQTELHARRVLRGNQGCAGHSIKRNIRAGGGSADFKQKVIVDDKQPYFPSSRAGSAVERLYSFPGRQTYRTA